MKPFRYLAPDTLDQAVFLYGRTGETSVYLAGGTDVIVKIKERWMAPDTVISLKNIRMLQTLSRDETSGALTIGSMVTHRTLETSPMIRTHFPIITDAVSTIGSVQVRNVATLGGNLINAVPSADGAIPMIALDGIAGIAGPKGKRAVPLTDFFMEPYRTVLEPGEILVDITTAPQPPNTGSAYVKFGRRAAMELPLIGVGVLISLDEHKERCIRARICLGVAAPTPMRAHEAESLLEGRIVTEELLIRAGRIAADESRVRDSIRGKAWHRKEMVRVLTRRMGMKCLDIIQRKNAR